MSRIAFFGPEATNTHAAARALFTDEGDLFLPYPTVPAVFEAVAAGHAEHGVVPIENSTEGSVRETLDCLLKGPARIERETLLPIQHSLLGHKSGTPSEAKAVLSHPQALAQCRKWLESNLPGLSLRAASSTAQAAKEVSSDPSLLAIASRLAAEVFGLEVVADKINDHEQNTTRFVAVTLRDAAPSGQDRSTLVFTTKHERGALKRVLEVLDEQDVNLTRIESRPLPERLWEYAFVVEIEGHQDDPKVAQAIQKVRAQGSEVKVLGSYPYFVSLPATENG